MTASATMAWTECLTHAGVPREVMKIDYFDRSNAYCRRSASTDWAASYRGRLGMKDRRFLMREMSTLTFLIAFRVSALCEMCSRSTRKGREERMKGDSQFGSETILMVLNHFE